MSLLQKRKWVGSRLLQHAIILALPGGFSAANGTGLQQVYLLVKLLRVLRLHAGTGKTATVSEQLKGHGLRCPELHNCKSELFHGCAIPAAHPGAAPRKEVR